jgi:2-dehydropantoate 2-reductase
MGRCYLPTLDIGVDHVTIHSGDGRFAASLSLPEARQYGILIYELDGGPLPDTRGGPFRLVTPGLGDLCAHVKNVVRVELTQGPGKDTRPSQDRPQH